MPTARSQESPRLPTWPGPRIQVQTPCSTQKKQANILTLIFKGALLISFPTYDDGFPQPLWADTRSHRLKNRVRARQPGFRDWQVGHLVLTLDSLPWGWMHLRGPHVHFAHSLAKQAPSVCDHDRSGAAKSTTQPASGIPRPALPLGVVTCGARGPGEVPAATDPQGPSAGSLGRGGSPELGRPSAGPRSAPCAQSHQKTKRNWSSEVLRTQSDRSHVEGQAGAEATSSWGWRECYNPASSGGTVVNPR